MADCLVVSAADWDQVTRAFCYLWLTAIVIALLARFDLGLTEWRVRRFMRRRRIARIREVRRGC